MKNILLTATAIICLLSAVSYAQDSLNYFPAHPGDKWFYDIPYLGGKDVTTIDSVSTDSVGKVVYIRQSGDRVNLLLSNRLVIDTTKGIVYNSYFNTKDSTWEYSELYHLNAKIGDNWFYDSTYSSLSTGLDTIYSAAIFGKPTKVKRFEVFDCPDTGCSNDPSTWFWQNQEDYAYGIGMIYMRLEGAGERWYLQGAIINGDTLGTIFTGVKEPKNNAPSKFVLLQNYPNPFNPSTTIAYDLPVASEVDITIYDMLGDEVKKFYFSSEAAGRQEVTWNSTNDDNQHVASGVYLYRFKATALNGKSEVFEKTAKLILMK